jgi:hypothetical protein
MKRVILCIVAAMNLPAQVDQERAATYLREAQELCEREGGKLWGISLCGPMVIADAATGTMATNRQPPAGKRPQALGYANAVVDWGGTRWTTLVWQMMPPDDAHARGRVMIHELYHRVQPQLGLPPVDGNNEHLDTLEGRYWMQLEWRALAKALASSGAERVAAAEDALAFRAKRRELFTGAADNERRLEVNEGLAQYTGTVVAAASRAAASADAIDQLRKSEQLPTFVRTFAYPSGVAYGLLLDEWSPGWTWKVDPTTDLGALAKEAARLQPSPDAEGAARAYGSVALRAAEVKREAAQKSRIAELRLQFVEGPVLVLPRPKTASFLSTGITPIPGEGSVIPSYRTTAEWGTLEAGNVLLSVDRGTLRVPAPANPDGRVLSGDGWKVELAPGWVVRRGARAGDWEVAREGER